MTRGARWIPWLMFAVWASWLTALQGVLAARTSLGPWTPDLGIALLVVCVGRFDGADVPKAALLVAAARIAHTVEPPAGVAAGILFATFVVSATRSVAEVGGASLRSLLAALLAWSFAGWLVLVHAVRATQLAAGDPAAFDAGLEPLGAVWRVGLSTGLTAFALGPALLALPGLSPLRRRRW